MKIHRKIPEEAKKLNAIYFKILIIFFVSAISGVAQTQTITLSATNGFPSSYICNTNQIINILSFIGTGTSADLVTISFHNGLKSTITVAQRSFTAAVGVFTGVTNILVAHTTGSDGGVTVLTFTTTSPTVQTAVPASAVVIPTDATGPVQIVLESSGDLVNWTSSLPGTYGNTYSNRFFRVRAIVQ